MLLRVVGAGRLMPGQDAGSMVLVGEGLSLGGDEALRVMRGVEWKAAEAVGRKVAEGGGRLMRV